MNQLAAFGMIQREALNQLSAYQNHQAANCAYQQSAQNMGMSQGLSGLAGMGGAGACGNALGAMQNTAIDVLYGYSLFKSYGSLGNVQQRAITQDSDTGDSALRRSASNAAQREEKAKAEEAYSERTKEPPQYLDELHRRIATGEERLTLKNSPIFGFMRWRFDSPFRWLEMWLYRRLKAYCA